MINEIYVAAVADQVYLWKLFAVTCPSVNFELHIRYMRVENFSRLVGL